MQLQQHHSIQPPSMSTNFKSIFSNVAVQSPVSPHPSFGRGTAFKRGEQRFAECPQQGPPIPLRADGKRKRVHPTREQALLLERFFEQNQKPDAKDRAEICRVVNINMRSVQIWFQNRRAKLKKDGGSINNSYDSSNASSVLSLHLLNGSKAGSISSEEDPDSAAETPTSSLLSAVSNLPHSHSQHHQQSGFWFPNQHHHEAARKTITPVSPSKSYTSFQVNEISVGSWRRIAAASTSSDALQVQLQTSPVAPPCIAYIIHESGFAFQMQILLSSIVDASIHPMEGNLLTSMLTIAVNSPPQFLRSVATPQSYNYNSTAFVPTQDFTQDSQASVCPKHVLEGPSSDMEKLFLLLSDMFSGKDQSSMPMAGEHDSQSASMFSSFQGSMLSSPLAMYHVESDDPQYYGSGMSSTMTSALDDGSHGVDASSMHSRSEPGSFVGLGISAHPPAETSSELEEFLRNAISGGGY